jgi:hyaluronan synthase
MTGTQKASALGRAKGALPALTACVWREVTHSRKYWYIFWLVFLFGVLLDYRWQVLKTATSFNFFVLYATLTFGSCTVKYLGCLFHFTERWTRYEPDSWPAVDVIIPAYNEGEAVFQTVASLAQVDYPMDKLTVVLVDDGSKDDTLDYINKAAAAFVDLHVVVIVQEKNQGKKEAMAAGIEQTVSDFLVFVDSDSTLEPDCLKEIIRPFFADDSIGAVSGHALVLNAGDSVLTKMQEIRYFNSFRSAKALESLLGFVSCCPGCCSSYRRSAVLPVMSAWLNQKFLGVKCTYGDDRSLTNQVLKSRWKTVYNERAVVYTIVADTLRKWNKQQLRWKKSWLRESVVVLSFAWRKNPLTASLMIVDTITPFIAPFVIARVIFLYTFVNRGTSLRYIVGILIFATCIGLFYRAHNSRGTHWWRGAAFSSLLALLTFWQLPYALVNLRDARWGTR